MNTLYFRYAVEVEKSGTISQAAENLFMGQPNLSKAIKELEDTLGITIFERTPRGVVPTAEGAEFLEYAKRILVELDNMKNIYITKKERKSRQALTISIPRVSYISVGFTNFIADLDMGKSIEICIEETNSLQTINNILDNNCDFGIIRYQTSYENYYLDYLKEKNLRYDTIWEFARIVLMSSRHPLAKSDSIDYQVLKNASIEIVYGDNMVPYLHGFEIKKARIKDDGSRSRKIYIYERGNQLELLTRIPYTYMWVSPLPQDLLQRYDLVQRRCLIPENSFKDVLIYPQGYEFKEIDKLLLNKVYEVKNEIAFVEYK